MALQNRFAMLGLLSVLALLPLAAARAAGSFVAFEAGQVRPVALSADGSRLLAVNTPDNRLEIFDIRADGLVHVASVPVGLEPVAVATRPGGEAWVVNQLSDSISVVDAGGASPRVLRTLLVGDEPPVLLGQNKGPNAVELLLAALGFCYSVGYVANAAARLSQGLRSLLQGSGAGRPSGWSWRPNE